ncbi:MAG: ABC transporter permease [Desulfovibrio sp.]
MIRRNTFEHVVIGGPFLWMIVFAFIPALLIVAASFLGRTEFEFFTYSFTLEGYRTILEPLFFRVLLRSVSLACGVTAFCLLAAYPFAYALAHSPRRYRGLFLLLTIIPFWTNSLVRIYALIFMLKMKGVVSYLAMASGVVDQPFSLMYTETAVFIGMVYTLLPFMILPIYSSLEKIDQRLVDAARDLGGSWFQAFRCITLPLSFPGIVAGCMMVFLPALGMFYIPDILGGGKHLIVGNYIKNQFLIARDWPAGSAASVVLTALMLFLMGLYLWIIKRRGSGIQGGGIG